MKFKKLVAICMTLVIMLGSITIVNAAEDGSSAVSEDAEIQAAYNAFVEISDALNTYDYDALKQALETFDEITAEFTDEQYDEWDLVVTDVIGYEEALTTVICAAMVIGTVEMMDAYQADPNAQTAYDFVYMYEECVDSEIEIDLFIAEIESVYETAKTVDMPSEGVLEVYDAYTYLELALAFLECGFYDEDFVDACEGFEAVLDIFNELTEDELTDLACLMDVEDAETAYNIILGNWINANLALELGAAYDAYLDNPEDETAASEFVEMYESILNDTQMLTDEDKAVILTSFEEAYEDAKNFLADIEDTSGEGQTTDESDEPVKDVSPDTGDNLGVVPFATLMMISAVVAGMAVKRRKEQ